MISSSLYNFLRSGQAITAVYWAKLRTMMVKLAEKQPRLVNWSSPHHYCSMIIVSSHCMRNCCNPTVQLEIIPHPPNLLNLVAIDFICLWFRQFLHLKKIFSWDSTKYFQTVCRITIPKILTESHKWILLNAHNA